MVRTSGNYIISTGPTTTFGQSVYPDIAHHISNYYIHIHVDILLPQSTSASFSAYYIYIYIHCKHRLVPDYLYLHLI
jgi:hypothetical protein